MQFCICSGLTARWHMKSVILYRQKAVSVTLEGADWHFLDTFCAYKRRFCIFFYRRLFFFFFYKFFRILALELICYDSQSFAHPAHRSTSVQPSNIPGRDTLGFQSLRVQVPSLNHSCAIFQVAFDSIFLTQVSLLTAYSKWTPTCMTRYCI